MTSVPFPVNTVPSGVNAVPSGVNTVPSGFRVVLDRSVRIFAGGTVVVGGHPGRLLTLSARGAEVLRALLADGTVTADTGRLARRLIDAGMAHPEAPDRGADLIGPPLTVVVPVHNRAATLERCLASLGPDADVVVVDDASDDPGAVAAVCRRHGARLIRRDVNGGPAAARNQAMAVVDSPLVAFVDSDCVVGDGWPGRLLAMFDDPVVGAVAPRVRPEGHDRDGSDRPSLLARFNQSHSSLDMGPEPSGVGPGCRVRYVPSAAIVMRTSALRTSTPGFDVDMRVGEDVDLVWRLVDAGWSVRYQPSVTVSHREPRTWGALWARRFSYGTSAGPLARRHRGRLAPVELRPWSAAAALAMVSGRYRSAVVMTAGGGALLALRLRGHDIPLATSARWGVATVGWTMVGIGRAATILAAPVLIGGLLHKGRARVGAGFLLVAPPLVEWAQRRPAIDPLRWLLASIADDAAYGAGVWVGCARSRSVGPLVPDIRV